VITSSVSEAVEAITSDHEFVIFNGPCQVLMESIPDQSMGMIVTSPPYFMGKDYDRSYKLSDFYDDHRVIAPMAYRILAEDGNLCWQVGYHVQQNSVFPLDFAVYEVFREIEGLTLRNRIMWHFGHGAHAQKRFSGRHETILWYGKGTGSYFDLDRVRVPQKYPGKRHYKGPKKGEFSGNPLGKNPSDVWDIPNVKSKHVEKTDHPCQFPVALVQRLVRALTKDGATVMDPYAGSGSSGIAAVLEGRKFIGADTSLAYCQIAESRYQAFKSGKLEYRPLERDIWQPSKNDSVAKKPEHFWADGETSWWRESQASR